MVTEQTDAAEVVRYCPACGHELHTLAPFCRCGCTWDGRDPWQEAHDAAANLGHEIAKALRLHEVVGWLNRRLTR